MSKVLDTENHLGPSPQVQPTPPATDLRFPRKLATVTLAVLLVVLLIYLFDRLSAILQPLFIALFILYALFPIKNWLRRRGVPTWMAYSIILVCVLGALVGLGALAYSNLDKLNPKRLAGYEDLLDQRLNQTLRWLGLGSDEPVQIRQFFRTENGVNVPLRESLLKFTGSFFNFLTGAFVVLVYMFFLLMEMAEFPHRLAEAFGNERAQQTLEVGDRINATVGDYISVMAFVAFLQGALSALVLGVMGVEFYLLWGLVIGLSTFIPYIGAFVAVSLPVALAFIQYPEKPWFGATVLILLLAIQGFVDNILMPRMTGHKMGVSPMLVVLSLAFWGWLWGMVGLLLAVPLTVTIKIIFEQMEATKPIAVLMKDK